MLPHNQIESPQIQRTRKIRFIIFIFAVSLLFYSTNLISDPEPAQELLQCVHQELNLIKFSNVTKQCYIYQMFYQFSQKHYRGFFNQTYTHFHVLQLNQLQPNFTIGILFSKSPYLDESQQYFQFSVNISDLYQNLETPNLITIQDKNENCSQQLTLEIQNITQFFSENNSMNVIVEQKCKQEQNNEEEIEIIYNGVVVDNTNDIEIQSIIYSCISTLICLCSTICGFRILQLLLEGIENADEYSLLSIGFIMVQDLYLCFLNFFQAMQSEHLFQYFIIPSFFQFLLFSIFEMRIMLLIWKSRLNQNSNLRNEIIKFYGKLYFMMFAFAFCIYEFISTPLMTFILSLYLIPQIIHSAQRGQYIKINLKLVLGFLLPRALYIVYFRLYTRNIYYLKPMPFLVMFVLIAIVAQLIIHFLQSEWGPQFFLPKSCLPKKYNYFINIPNNYDIEEGPSQEDSHLFQEECAICMTPLHHIPVEKMSQNEERNFIIKNALAKQSKYFMKTPCDHKFHVLCLVKWMTIKLSCPSCRQALPPL